MQRPTTRLQGHPQIAYKADPFETSNLFFPSLPTLWVRNDRGGGGVVLIGVDGVCLVKARRCWLVDRGRSWRGEHFFKSEQR